jgi:hypothetical protein
VCSGTECKTNSLPVANAGVDQVAGEATTVTLDGRNSHDPDGEPLIFVWTQLEGPAVELDDDTSDTPHFVAPSVAAPTVLEFELVVSDGVVGSAADSTTVTVQNTVNEAPVADAGPDAEVTEGQVVQLDGSGSADPNGDPLSYLWSQTGGPVVEMTTTVKSSTAFMAPQVETDTLLSFKLVVNDGMANSAPDDVVVTSWESKTVDYIRP